MFTEDYVLVLLRMRQKGFECCQLDYLECSQNVVRKHFKCCSIFLHYECTSKFLSMSKTFKLATRMDQIIWNALRMQAELLEYTNIQEYTTTFHSDDIPAHSVSHCVNCLFHTTISFVMI